MTLSLAMVARKKSPADGMSFWWPTHIHCFEKMSFCSSAKISSETKYFCANVLAPLRDVGTLPGDSSFVDVFTCCFDNLDTRRVSRQASTDVASKETRNIARTHDSYSRHYYDQF